MDPIFDPAKTDPMEAVMAQAHTEPKADPAAAAGAPPEKAPAPAGAEEKQPAAKPGEQSFAVGKAEAPAGEGAGKAGEAGKAAPEAKPGEGEPAKDGTAKPEGEAKEEGKEKKEGGDEAAPQYQPFTYPEGVTEDKELVAGFLPVAQKLKLSQEQAQELVDLQVQAALKSRQEDLKAQEAFIRSEKARFQKELEADPDVGGAFHDRTMERANLALRTYDRGGKMGALLAQWNIEVQPDIVRFLEAVGAGLEEDYAPAGGSGGKEKTAAEVLFPDLK